MPTKEERIEEDRKEALAEYLESSGLTLEEVKNLFGPGTAGNHEVLDRVYVQNQVWDSFVLSHFSVLLNEKLYAEAYEIYQKMCKLYQSISQFEIDPPPNTERESGSYF